MARARHGSYLFQRSGSQNWWIKVRSGGRRIERSLGTPDRGEAELRAVSVIGEHKARLLAGRPRIEPVWQHQYEPGREHIGPDGGRIIATDRDLIHLDGEGRVIRTEPNGAQAFQISSLPRLGIYVPVPIDVDATAPARPKPASKTADDDVIETYLKERKITGHFANEARSVWALYKELTHNKPLKDAKRADGRLLVEYFEGRGLKSATIRKKIAWLGSAVALAIRDDVLRFNPFAGLVPKPKGKRRDADAAVRLPLDDADMAVAKAKLYWLSDADQLLFRLSASSHRNQWRDCASSR